MRLERISGKSIYCFPQTSLWRETWNNTDDVANEVKGICHIFPRIYSNNNKIICLSIRAHQSPRQVKHNFHKQKEKLIMENKLTTFSEQHVKQ